MNSSINFSSDLKGVAMLSTYAKNSLKLMLEDNCKLYANLDRAVEQTLNSAYAGGVFGSGQRETAREYLWSLF
jgi:hypothetical protein